MKTLIMRIAANKTRETGVSLETDTFARYIKDKKIPDSYS